MIKVRAGWLKDYLSAGYDEFSDIEVGEFEFSTPEEAITKCVELAKKFTIVNCDYPGLPEEQRDEAFLSYFEEVWNESNWWDTFYADENARYGDGTTWWTILFTKLQQEESFAKFEVGDWDCVYVITFDPDISFQSPIYEDDEY